MAASEADLARFIRDNIPTVWALELLLVMHADTGKSWSPDALVRELRASTTLVQHCLLQFSRRGIITQGAEGWSLAPGAELHALLELLALTYRQRPIATVSLIRRSDPIQALADAFRIDGGDDD